MRVARSLPSSGKTACETVIEIGGASCAGATRRAAARSAPASRSAASRPAPGARRHERELVAADAREAVGRADLGRRVRGELAQHAVAGAVAEAVVDLLERVDVDQQQREARLGAGQRVVERGLERAPVGEPGQRVLVGHPALVALGLDQAALEELDRQRQPGVGDGIAERALDEQVRARRVEQRRRVGGDLQRGQRPCVARREEVRDVEHRQHEHRAYVRVGAAGQPQARDHERLQQRDRDRMAADRHARPRDRAGDAAGRVGEGERDERPEPARVRVRGAGQRPAGHGGGGAGQPQQAGHGSHKASLVGEEHRPLDRRAGEELDATRAPATPRPTGAA
jgi:hypothetical protein